MAKTQRLITIDLDLNKKLGEQSNASALLGDLLEKHFNAHLSNDLEFLTAELDNLDLKIKGMELTRDNIASRIRVLNEKAKAHQEENAAKQSIVDKEKELRRWLNSECKKTDSPFENFSNIKNLDNWQDCVEMVMAGNLKFEELVEKAKSLNTTTTNNIDGENESQVS